MGELEDYAVDLTRLSPETKIIVLEALKRNIKLDILDYNSELIQTDLNEHILVFKKTPKIHKGNIELDLLNHKHYTKLFLRRNRFPVPDGAFCTTRSGALKYAKKIGFPLIVKSAFKKKTSKDIWSESQLKSIMNGWNHGPAIVEKYIIGKYYHVLVFGENIRVIERVPAHIIGDGRKTIRKLIEEKNQNRAEPLKTLRPTSRCIKAQDYTLDSIPEFDKKVLLAQSPSLKQGGGFRIVVPHLKTKELFLRLSNTLGMKLLAFDVVANNIERTWEFQNFAILDIHKNLPLDYFTNVEYSLPARLWDFIEFTVLSDRDKFELFDLYNH